MENTTVFSIPPPIFDGHNYQCWAIRMIVHLEALDLWEAVEADYEIPPLPNNPTLAQMKIHKEKKTRKSKAKACLFSVISKTIFTKIMNLETAKEIWDFLKEEYQGNERTRNMQVLNLVREFEMMKMNETETIKDYSDKLMGIVNKVRLLGKDFADDRIVQKILVTLPEKYEAKISSLEESKDLSSISLAELLNALQALEQRRMMRKEEAIEGALLVKTENLGGKDNDKNWKENHPPCPHCKKTNHPQNKCWWRPDVQCRKCGKIGHMERICKTSPNEEAKTSIEQCPEELFVATCFVASNNSSNYWLIDSGCTNHMTNDQELFIELDKTNVSKLVERGFKVIFEDKHCLIKDVNDKEVFKIKMGAKNFVLNPMEGEQKDGEVNKIQDQITNVSKKE